MNFHRRQTVERLNNRLVGQAQRLGDRFAFNHVGRHRACRNGGRTAVGVKLHVGDNPGVDFNIHFHNIAALGVADFADAVCIFDFADIVGVREMLQYFFTVFHYALPLSFWILSHKGDMLRSRSMISGTQEII